MAAIHEGSTVGIPPPFRARSLGLYQGAARPAYGHVEQGKIRQSLARITGMSRGSVPIHIREPH